MNYKPQVKPNNLRKARTALGLRQQDVADILGFCTTDRISHWEIGRGMPNVLNLFRLCAIYKIYPDNLYPDLFEKIIKEYTKEDLMKR